jgi:hypothetical protein
MSIPVDTAALAEALERYGDSAYLLTTGDRGGPHAVAVRLSWDGGSFLTRTGVTSGTNLAARPDVTLLWSALGEDDYSLIVDGTAFAEDGDWVRITPVRAVLHRNPARSAQDEPGSECVSVLKPAAGRV